METTERIVEAYVRYVKGWATIPNIRCGGQNEIDLLAINPVTNDRYHIEVSISISQGFRKLTAKPFDRNKVKERIHQAGQRRTLGFFVERKFGVPTVVETLARYGFEPDAYKRVIVTWGWEDGVAEQAEKGGIELWDFRDIITEIAKEITGSREYFADDTLRTLNLFVHANAEATKKGRRQSEPGPSSETDFVPTAAGGAFWVYENWIHKYAAVHRGSCSFCNDGRGMHAGSSKDNGEWLGPFASAANALKRAEQTGQREIKRCAACSPVD